VKCKRKANKEENEEGRGGKSGR